MNREKYDLIVIGSGAAGIMAAIVAARDGKKVLLLEKLSQISAKLKATGGGRCNLTNTLDNDEFMSRFGKDGRFMRDALEAFDKDALVSFFAEIGVDTHSPDGFRIFPTSHSSSTIIEALKQEMNRVGITLHTQQKVQKILYYEKKVTGVQTQDTHFDASNVIVATGGLGYPTLGAEGDGYKLAQALGHTITPLYPAMTPLKTKESWVAECRADTIAKVQLQVDLKKHKKLKATGDLIFTKTGIRGPVVLDFAREITPLLHKYGEVPITMQLTQKKNQDEILQHFKKQDSTLSTLELTSTLLPQPLALQLCKLADADPDITLKKQPGHTKAKLVKILAATPLTINNHNGFEMAMITRGGIKLKEVDPKTMQSKLIKGVYFCGEVLNIDGPCGGYNLQWSFSSGYLAGKLL